MADQQKLVPPTFDEMVVLKPKTSGMPVSVKVHPVHGSYCSDHGYAHRVMCPGCAAPRSVDASG